MNLKKDFISAYKFLFILLVFFVINRMCENIHDKEQWHLLQSLRSTVEGLLIDGVSNVWDVYGGLNRLHNVMEQIFKHGCRIFDPNVS